MKPCPFCGADASRLHAEAVQHGTVWASAVVCRDCDARGPRRLGSTPEVAERLARYEWDKRGTGLDVLLCPGCGASVEPTLHPAEDDYPAGWSAECGRCGYDLSGGGINDGDPPTLRRILAGAELTMADDVDIGAYTRAVARVLGVLS